MSPLTSCGGVSPSGPSCITTCATTVGSCSSTGTSAESKTLHHQFSEHLHTADAVCRLKHPFSPSCRKILFIRPKMSMANDGNYREIRWFVAWKLRLVISDVFSLLEWNEITINRHAFMPPPKPRVTAVMVVMVAGPEKQGEIPPGRLEL